MKILISKDECQKATKILTKRLSRLSLHKKAKKKFRIHKRLAFKKTPHNTSQFLIANYEENIKDCEDDEDIPAGTMISECSMGAFLNDTRPFEQLSFYSIL